MSSDNYKYYKTLGQLIKDFRQWRKQSQDEFAELTGVSVRQLRRWEADLSHASIENLQDIANITKIPMEVCISLNADNPLWYSLKKKRFAYTLIEADLIRVKDLLKSYKQPGRKITAENDKRLTDKYIDEVLSYHNDTYGTKKPLNKDVLAKAIKMLPDLNRITFDHWGLMVGYVICLPIRIDIYQKLIKQKTLENYLAADKISDILTMNKGVFLHYSMFATNLGIAYPMMVNNLKYLSTVNQKERYLAAFHTSISKGKEFYTDLGLRIAWKAHEYGDVISDDIPEILEIELDKLINRFESYSPPEPVDTPKPVDGMNPDTKESEIDIKKITCPNPECVMNNKFKEGNIVFNGTYKTKQGALRRRFICKTCKRSFCTKAGSMFYGLKSSEEKIIAVLNLLIKGMSLTGTANVMKVKFDTVRRWLAIAAGQRGKIDAMLIEKLKVSQSELDSLWAHISEDSLRKRAIHLRKSFKSHKQN